MMGDPRPSLAERVWEMRLVRRVAATPSGRWLAARPSMRAPLDAIHARQQRRATAPDMSPLPRIGELTPARRHSARTADGSVPVTRFVVIAEGRSGSTLLVHELGRRWPNLRAAFEVFSRQHAEWTSFEESLQRIFLEPDDAGRRIVGCKVLIGQLSMEQLREVLELDDMHVIVLRRRDLLRRHVSEQIARSTQQWQLTADSIGVEASDRTLTVDVAAFHQRLRLSSRFFEDVELLTRDLPRIEVWYEDLGTDLDTELRRVATFLGAGEPAQEPPPQLIRQNPEPLRLLVRNLDEVHEFLRMAGRDDLIVEDEPRDRPTSADEGDALGLTPFELSTIRLAFSAEEDLPETCDDWLMQREGVAPDRNSHRLDPLVRRQLRRAGSSAGPLDALERRHRVSSVVTLRTMAVLPEVHTSLAAVGIDAIVIGGSAIALRSTTQLGIHPMIRLDLALRPDSIDLGAAALVEDGWTRSTHDRLDRDGLELLLHPRLLARRDDPDLERDLRARAVTVDRDDVELRTLTPSDQLLSILAGGPLGEHDPSSSIGAVIDALFILDADCDRLDWVGIRSLATQHQCLPALAESLRRLDRLLPGVVADDVRHSLLTSGSNS